jgi:hypothetical protein
MESDMTPRTALAATERATGALWTRYPPTPWWYPPAGGAWCAALVLALGGLRDSPPLLLAALAGLLAVSLWFRSWYTRYRGTLPRVDSAPAEFRRAIAALGAGTVVLVVATVLVDLTVGYPAAGLLAFAGTTVGLAVYERAYASAAAATRERLG